MGGVVRALLAVWSSEPRGRVLLLAWGASFAGVTIRALLLRRPRLHAPTRASPTPSATRAKKSPLARIARLAVPHRSSRPVVYAAALSLSIGFRLLFSIKMSQEIGVLGSMLSKRQWEGLYRRQLTYAIVAIPAAFFNALMKYSSAQMALTMRDNITRQLHLRYGAASSLSLALSPLEGGVQMGTADVSACCTSMVALFEGLFKPSVEVVLLSAKLASMMGLKQLIHCYAFFGIAGTWTRMVGPSFATMSEAAQAADGELLSHRSRVHAYSEEITMLRGAGAEVRLMDEAADAILSRSSRLHLEKLVSEALDGYVLRYVGILAAFTAMLPAVIHPCASRSSASDDPTEYFLTCLHLLVNVGMALKDLVLSHKAAATTSGLATRVATLLDALENSALDPSPSFSPPSLPSPSPSPATPSTLVAESTEGTPLLLRLDGLRVSLPSGAELLQPLSLEVGAGQRILVCGPNGCGKSSLLRVLSGVWLASAGTMQWSLPPSDRLLLPQRPYLIPGASLRLNLLYPAPPSTSPPDKQLLSALAAVGLSHLTDLDSSGTCDGLSPGEQQRLGLARVLVCKPAIAFLDEPCSAVDPNFEMSFFEECARQHMTLMTVSHRREASVHYTHKLRIDGRGSAKLIVIDSNKGDDSSTSEDFVHAES